MLGGSRPDAACFAECLVRSLAPIFPASHFLGEKRRVVRALESRLDAGGYRSRPAERRQAAAEEHKRAGLAAVTGKHYARNTEDESETSVMPTMRETMSRMLSSRMAQASRMEQGGNFILP
jgi:hypothetical protein